MQDILSRKGVFTRFYGKFAALSRRRRQRREAAKMAGAAQNPQARFCL
jgi:hypothetical protein